jgi:TetR/AcrR family transcriptional repressor of mexJK operon
MTKKTATKETRERSKTELRTGLLLDRLLDAATTFFLEKGFDATSMGEIAKHAHASTETFYRHFPTKEELFERVLLRCTELFKGELSSVLMSQVEPEEALTAFGELGLSLLLAPEALSLHRVLVMEKGRFPEVVDSFHAQGPVKVQDALASYLAEQVKKGKLHKMNPDVGARQFFDLVIPEFHFGMELRSRPAPTRAEMRQRVKEAIDCFLHGYGSGVQGGVA